MILAGSLQFRAHFAHIAAHNHLDCGTSLSFLYESLGSVCTGFLPCSESMSRCIAETLSFNNTLRELFVNRSVIFIFSSPFHRNQFDTITL